MQNYIYWDSNRPKGKHGSSHIKLRSDNPKTIELRKSKAEAKRQRRHERNLKWEGIKTND